MDLSSEPKPSISRLEEREESFGDWMALAVATIVAVVIFAWLRSLSTSVWFQLPLAVLSFVIIRLLFKARRVAWALANPNPKELEMLDPRPPILYLRSFSQDKLIGYQPGFGYTRSSILEEIETIFGDFGPVIGLGNPKKGSPDPGVALEFCENEAWEDEVRNKMRGRGSSPALDVMGRSVEVRDALNERGAGPHHTLGLLTQQGVTRCPAT